MRQRVRVTGKARRVVGQARREIEERLRRDGILSRTMSNGGN
jgi:hypothetical protein